jgi:hypothetical protein
MDKVRAANERGISEPNRLDPWVDCKCVVCTEGWAGRIYFYEPDGRT